MIKVSFSSREVSLTSERRGRSVSFAYRDHPTVFQMPKRLIVDSGLFANLVRESVRTLDGALLPPKIHVSVDTAIDGGFAQIDDLAIRDAFLQVGAREVDVCDSVGGARYKVHAPPGEKMKTPLIAWLLLAVGIGGVLLIGWKYMYGD